MAESQILDPHLMRIASSRQKEIRSKGSTGYHPKERERRKVDKKRQSAKEYQFPGMFSDSIRTNAAGSLIEYPDQPGQDKETDNATTYFLREQAYL
jgi:hypothetical protein